MLEAVGAGEDAVMVRRSPIREVRGDHNQVISVHRWTGSRVFSIVRHSINALADAAKRGVEIIFNSVATGKINGELELLTAGD